MDSVKNQCTSTALRKLHFSFEIPYRTGVDIAGSFMTNSDIKIQYSNQLKAQCL